jgi:hypothetical protein
MHVPFTVYHSLLILIKFWRAGQESWSVFEITVTVKGHAVVLSEKYHCIKMTTSIPTTLQLPVVIDLNRDAVPRSVAKRFSFIT